MTSITKVHRSINKYDNPKNISMVFIMMASLLTFSFSNMADADSSQGPDEIINTTTQQMLDALKQDHQLISERPNHIHQLANRIIMPHVDFKRMSSWVLGKHWRRATDEQKQQFPAQFRNLILRTYATALSEYTDETITYLPLRASNDKTDVTVRTIIERNSGPGIPVAYRMHLSTTGWKVYDISIDGISLVNNYRRSFSSEIRRHGLDSLINKLTKKNKSLVSQHSQLASN